MKLKNLLITSILVLLATSLTLGAQTGVETGTPFGSGDDSIQCRQNISLFTTYVKAKNFKEAYPFWLEALEKCPGSTKNIYLYGVQIMNWKIEKPRTMLLVKTLSRSFSSYTICVSSTLAMTLSMVRTT